MAKTLERKVIKLLKGTTKFIFSHRFIPVLKGTIGYCLAFVLIFLKRFDDISPYPLAYSSMMIVVIANGTGKSAGACIQATAFSMLGVSLGSVGFVVLAKLSPWPVAQGVVFACIVYAMALVKARGLRWFGFSLLCILNSFNGVYTSYMLGSVFSPTYLKAYYTAYLWGAAIVLSVNLLILPTSSERELRQTLVVSLEHLGTFAHLLAKGYTLEITEAERAIREHLNRTIRADFGFLTQKIEETTIEINYSRFSLKDYQCFVSRTRALQQALITAHSSLASVEKQNVELFKERFLPDTMVAFNRLRRAVDLTIRDIGSQLGNKPMVIPATQAKYNEFMDIECKGAPTSDELSSTVASSSDDLANQLALVSERLAAEVDTSTVPSTPRAVTPEPSAARSAENGYRHEEHSFSLPSELPTSTATAVSTPHGKADNLPRRKTECGVERLRREFDAYSVVQHDILQETLVSGQLEGATDGQLRLHLPRPSLRDVFGLDFVDGDVEGDIFPAKRTVRERSGADKKNASVDVESGDTKNIKVNEGQEQVLMDGHSLIRVWSFLFALEQFVSELETLSMSVRPGGILPKKRLCVHFFEALHRPHRKAGTDDEDKDLPLAEALALLEKRPYTAVKPNVWQQLDQVQHIIVHPTSIYAAKTAAAATVFGTLIFATAPRPWFINYALSSGMLTIVVALAPTLGQSILTFLLQIGGSGIGYLWGLALLSMFHNVGGFTYNPYGIVCLLVPYALIMHFVLYEYPTCFVVALLGLNGTGVLVATEWVAVEHLHRQNFDSPALRTGKALTALMVALAIAAIFQLFILRNPARRTLRKKVAGLTFEILSYVVLLQAFGRSVLSSDPKYRPSKPALMRVERELRHRELKLQSEIIQTLPLLRRVHMPKFQTNAFPLIHTTHSFAAAEPQLANAFRKDIVLRFVTSNQLVLDRLREARAALGTQLFEDFILTHFVSVLSPYRVRNTRMIKGQLYLIASSLQSKAPLPHDTPMSTVTNSDRADFIHDILVLSYRFAQTEEGKTSIRSREFMRYVSYLLCSISINEPLKVMEDASKQLFGELERKLV